MSTNVVSSEIAGQKTDQHKHLERRALKGTSYVVVAYGLAMGLRLISSMVLSRLFAPAYFGLMALTTTIIVGLYLVSHLGRRSRRSPPQPRVHLRHPLGQPSKRFGRCYRAGVFTQ